MNIVEPIFVQCRTKPGDLALAAPGADLSMMSYGRLRRSVDNFCTKVLSLDLLPGQRVAVFIQEPILHCVALIALARLGIVTVSGRKKDFSWRFSIDAVISDSPYNFVVPRIILVDQSWIAGDSVAIDEKKIHRGSAAEVCRVMLTSGTTGEEKGVAVTNRVMAARIDRQSLFFGRRATFCARTYLDLGLYNALGYQVLLATLWRGGALILPGDPQRTISALPIYKVQNMVSSPRGLLKILEAVERRPEYQCGLEAAFTAGSALPGLLV